MDKREYAIGVDLGGTNIKTVAIDADGNILHRKTVPTGPGRSEWADSVRGCMAEYEQALGSKQVGIAVAAPGLPARDGKTIYWMQGRLEELQGFEWQTAICSQEPVSVVNDAHAAVLGESWTGAAAGSSNVLMLTLGTGVGGGAIVDGRVLRGHLGRAGHVGHITVNMDGPLDIVRTPGSLEDAIGDCTVLARSEGRYTSTKELVAAHAAGERQAATIWLRSVRSFCSGLVSLINVLDPEIVVLGGGISEAGSLLFQPLAEEMDRIEWRPTGVPVAIVPAVLGEWAGAVGAGRIAWNKGAFD